MAPHDKKGAEENKSDTPSICCSGFSCLSITKRERSYTSYDFKTLWDRCHDGISDTEFIRKTSFCRKKRTLKRYQSKSCYVEKKGEEILKTAVPLVEKIDELFFGKLNSHEEQFKHFLIKLNKE